MYTNFIYMQIADYYAAHKIHTLLFLKPLCYVTIWLLGRIGVISKKHCMCSFCKYLKSGHKYLEYLPKFFLWDSAKQTFHPHEFLYGY